MRDIERRRRGELGALGEKGKEIEGFEDELSGIRDLGRVCQDARRARCCARRAHMRSDFFFFFFFTNTKHFLALSKRKEIQKN